MNKVLRIFPFIVALLLFGCSSDQTTVQIIRSPLFQFDLSSTNSWKSDGYSLVKTSQVVEYPKDSTLPAQFYDRYVLTGTGKDDSGRTYQITVDFDVVNGKQLVGLYKNDYTSERGLGDVQLVDLTDKKNLVVYNLCAKDLQNDILQIEKQKPDERIITGSFQMTVCNSRDSTQKLTIMNGMIKDLKY
ncbi:MAG: hypothetical protein ABI136_01485 [Ginsengibacter sp.]